MNPPLNPYLDYERNVAYECFPAMQTVMEVKRLNDEYLIHSMYMHIIYILNFEQSIIVRRPVQREYISNISIRHCGQLDLFVRNYDRKKFDFGFILTAELMEDLVRDGCNGNVPDAHFGIDIDENIGCISYIKPTTPVSFLLHQGNATHKLALRKLYISKEELTGGRIYWQTI